jgi:transcriptional regulator with XRE-family HTH domain
MSGTLWLDSEQIKRILKQAGREQKDLAFDAKINESNLSKYLNGKSKVTRDVAERLIAALPGGNHSLDDLILEADDPLPPGRASAPESPGPVVTDPYDPFTPAVPPRFVGRTAILRELEQAAWQGKGVSLVGEWRIGKTSILQTWGQRADEIGLVVRRVSGHDAARQGLGAFVSTVTGTGGLLDPGTVPDTPDGAADRLQVWCDLMRADNGGSAPGPAAR